MGYHLNNIGELFAYDPQAPMIFNTGVFLFFFLLFLGGYIFLAGYRSKRIVYVIVFSLFFYYKSSGFYFILLLVSTLIDYILGLLIYRYHIDYPENQEIGIWVHDEDKGVVASSRRTFYGILESIVLAFDRFTHRFVSPENTFGKRRLYLIMSIILNLGLLAYFKYTPFFIETVNAIWTDGLDASTIFLPVGISFFTFQTMSYTIDIYRLKLAPVRSILDFAFYVSFFPQLVAGPIVRAADFLPQIRQRIRVSAEDLGQGLLLICTGLFKKAVISDYISVNFVDRVFENPGLYSGFENLMGVYGYALQIYCDFSGYSDMAIGIGLLLGFRLPINFNAPYQSASIQEFWRRWHISLSTWLRDYLYISLGGNRRGKLRTYVNLLITMVLGGLWHGASWTFVFWGFMHGIALAIDRLLKETKQYLRMKANAFLDKLDQLALEEEAQGIKSSGINEYIRQARWFMQGWVSLVVSVLSHLGGVIFTFHFVCFCWIFFRADSYEIAKDIIYRIMNEFNGQLAWQVMTGYREVFLLMLLGYLLHFLPDDLDRVVSNRFIQSPVLVKALTAAVVFWLVIQTRSAEVQPFIYFQF